MTLLIRRERRRRRTSGKGLAMGLAGLVLAGGVLTLAWVKGGPQPVHSIAIALPATEVGG